MTEVALSWKLTGNLSFKDLSLYPFKIMVLYVSVLSMYP